MASALLRLKRSLTDGTAFDVLLVSLALIYLLIFTGFPLIYNVVMSFQEVDMFSLATLDRPFVGTDNYETVFDNRLFWLISGNTVYFVVVSILFQFTIGFALALFFQGRFPFATYLRGLFLVGWIMPLLVVGAIWRWILAGDFGVLNHTLMAFGLIDGPVYWLSDPDLALTAVTMANIWLGIPFNMILLSVGLAGIPRELHEAAELDGAGVVRRFWYVTLPLMRPTMAAVISLGVILTMQQFDLFVALTQGGPANASNVAQLWSWQLSFRTFQFAEGAAVASLMLVVVLVVAVIYVRSTRSEVRY